jgi:hypothetical protein
MVKVVGQSYTSLPAIGTNSKSQPAGNSFIDAFAKVNDAFTEGSASNSFTNDYPEVNDVFTESIGKLVGRNTEVGTIYVPAAKVENLIAFNLPDNNKAPLI